MATCNVTILQNTVPSNTLAASPYTVSIPNIEQCKNSLCASPQYVAFAWANDASVFANYGFNVSACPAGQPCCVFFNNVPGQTNYLNLMSVNGITTGLVPSVAPPAPPTPPTPPAPSCQMQQLANTSINGITTTTLASSATDCQNICCNTSKCAGYTYTPSNQWCNLLYSVTGTQSAPGAISGLVNQPSSLSQKLLGKGVNSQLSFSNLFVILAAVVTIVFYYLYTNILKKYSKEKSMFLFSYIAAILATYHISKNL